MLKIPIPPLVFMLLVGLAFAYLYSLETDCIGKAFAIFGCFVSEICIVTDVFRENQK